MRISRIKIKNYSRIKDLDLSIRRHAVIVGANDVGKSSILRMLNLILGASMSELYRELTPEDIRDHREPLEVDVYWDGFSDKNRIPFPNEISIGEDGEAESLWVQLLVELNPDDDSAVSVRRWFPESGHTRMPNRDQIDEFGWRYLPASRGSSLMDEVASPVRSLFEAADVSEKREVLEQKLDEFNAELGSIESVRDITQQVARHLNRSMPKTISADDISVRSATDPSKGVFDKVSIVLNRGGEQVTLGQQSDGTRQRMSMTLFDLAEGAANVLAIDEPELYLHPTSQRTAADLLSSGRNQKFIVTHSPFILHRFEPDEVIAVDRTGECHQVNVGEMTNAEKLKAQWWSPILLEALTARFVVIVEGDSDRIIVEAVARQLGVDLDRLGVVVIALDGASNFPNIFPLIGPDGFGPTLFGLVDEDAARKWWQAFSNNADEVVDKKIFISGSDLEEEYTRALGPQEVVRRLANHGIEKPESYLQAAGVTSLEDLTVEQVAARCRKNAGKRNAKTTKVDRAIGIAEDLTVDEAIRITSVSKLLHVLKKAAEA